MYIDSSTFWVIAIGLGIAIGLAYCTNRNRINKLEEELETIKKKLDYNNAQVYSTMHEVVKEIENGVKHEIHKQKTRQD